METVDTKYVRTKEEVCDTLQLAIIKESDLCPVTQILYPATEESVNKNIKLLELDDCLLNALKEGDSLSFRGKRHDIAVLCTDSQTYDIKEAETSNSCLLIPNLKFAKEVDIKEENDRVIERHNIKGIYHTYYEVRECRPKLENLLDILEPSSFKGVEYESTIESQTLYDWKRLQNEVQSSDKELAQALKNYLIINVDGYLRLISFEAEARCLSHMLNVYDSNSWELDEVDKELTYECLKDLVFEPVLDCLFKKYTHLSEKTKANGDLLYRYDEDIVCKAIAKILLDRSPLVEYNIFIESWNAATPENITPKEEYLNGVALIKWDNTTKTKDVLYFPESRLSKDINERFHELFKAKNKWTVQEITPYIINLTEKKMNVNALLTKFARCSVINGIKYYSSRHGK